MRTTATDRQVLATCALAVVAGVTLIAVGLVIDPARALLRRIT